MSFVRSFTGFSPPPRYEAEADPFTEALIEEAASRDGTYAVIDTFILEPVDSNPSEPRTRNFSTDQAQLDPGWYRLTWRDASGDTITGSPLSFPTGPEWTPSVAEVAALIRARTKIPGGGEAGTFNTSTRPTANEAEAVIAQAVDHVAAAIGGDPCTESLKESAGAAASLLAAVIIETSYWPEQAEARGSAAARLEKLFDSRMKSLTSAVAEQCGGQGEGESGDGNSGAIAAGSFNDGYALIGRDYPPRW